MITERISWAQLAREMREWIEALNQSDIEQYLAQKQIKWKFHPPGAPHFGGVWERMVRSCRKAMMAIVGNRTLTDVCIIHNNVPGRADIEFKTSD